MRLNSISHDVERIINSHTILLSEEVNVISDVYEYLVVDILSSCHFLSDYPAGIEKNSVHTKGLVRIASSSNKIY